MFHKKDARLILVKRALKRTVDMFTMGWSVNVTFLVILNCFWVCFFGGGLVGVWGGLLLQFYRLNLPP